MAIDPALLPHTCTIQTPDAVSADALGHSEDGTFTATYTGVACRFYGFQQGRELFRGAERVVADYMLDLLPSQAITETHRVSAILDGVGASVMEGALFEVVNVRPAFSGSGATHHKIAYLKLLR